MSPARLVLAAAFVAMAAAGRAAEVLTVEEAVAVALKSHPYEAEAREAMAGARARRGQALAAYYPQISVAGDWNKSRAYSPVVGMFKDSEVNTAAVYLKQTLYDFGRTSGAVKAAGRDQAAAEQAYAAVRQDVSFRVKTAYYLVLAAEKQVAADLETVKARDEVYQQALSFFTEGVRPKIDSSRARSNLYAAKTALVRAENNRDLARLELASAMGRVDGDPRSLVEPEAALPDLPAREVLQQQALAQRAEMRRLEMLRSAAAAGAGAIRSDYLPVFSGTASAGRADRDFPPGGAVWSVGANLSLPLFSGFATREKAREADSALRAIEAAQKDLRLVIIKELDAAWLSAREAAARTVSTGMQVEAARENRALAGERYHEGVGSIIEVTDAQSQAIDAETAQIQATYDARIALARLDRAVGKE